MTFRKRGRILEPADSAEFERAQLEFLSKKHFLCPLRKSGINTNLRFWKKKTFVKAKIVGVWLLVITLFLQNKKFNSRAEIEWQFFAILWKERQPKLWNIEITFFRGRDSIGCSKVFRVVAMPSSRHIHFFWPPPKQPFRSVLRKNSSTLFRSDRIGPKKKRWLRSMELELAITLWSWKSQKSNSKLFAENSYKQFSF